MVAYLKAGLLERPGRLTMAKAVVRAMDDSAAQPVERSRGATIQVLLGPEDGAPHFVTRRFTLEPGGRIPSHRHDAIEHEQVVLEGSMVLELDGLERPVSAGDCVLIPAGVAHSYENRGDRSVRFLCMVPRTDDYQTEWLEPPARAPGD
jgi:quercetin dioxygenase-like cupin family protein